MDEKDFIEAWRVEQEKVNDIEVPELEPSGPVNPETKQPTIVLPKDLELPKKALAEEMAKLLAPMVFNFVVSKINELALQIAQREDAKLIDRMARLETRISTLENRLRILNGQ